MPGHHVETLDQIEARLEELRETVQERKRQRKLVERRVATTADRQADLSRLREMLAAV